MDWFQVTADYASCAASFGWKRYISSELDKHGVWTTEVPRQSSLATQDVGEAGPAGHEQPSVNDDDDSDGDDSFVTARGSDTDNDNGVMQMERSPEVMCTPGSLGQDAIPASATPVTPPAATRTTAATSQLRTNGRFRRVVCDSDEEDSSGQVQVCTAADSRSAASVQVAGRTQPKPRARAILDSDDEVEGSMSDAVVSELVESIQRVSLASRPQQDDEEVVLDSSCDGSAHSDSGSKSDEESDDSSDTVEIGEDSNLSYSEPENVPDIKATKATKPSLSDRLFTPTRLVSTAQQHPSHVAGVPNRKPWESKREDVARSLFQEFNARVFHGKLSAELPLLWNPKLLRTAGLTRLKTSRESGVRSSIIELSCKVLDCEDRLAKTLLHELCHAAAWEIDGCARPPHGAVFLKWAAACGRVYPQHQVTITHSYAIHYKYTYTCSTNGCPAQVQRHSKSLNLDAVRCARCGGRFELRPAMKADGTPAKARAASGFSKFVRDNYGHIQELHPDWKHNERMAELASMWKARKAIATTQ